MRLSGGGEYGVDAGAFFADVDAHIDAAAHTDADADAYTDADGW